MTKPNFKVKTLKEAREEMAKFGITEKVSTLSQAKTLLLAKRAELAQAKSANPTKPVADEATSTVATISKPTIAPLATAKAATVSKPVAVDVGSYLGLRMKQISGVYLTKNELAILSVADDTTAVIEQAIETLSKTAEYRDGVLLSNAHSALQKCELTKHLDPLTMHADIKTSKAIKLKSEREQKHFANWRTSSK